MHTHNVPRGAIKIALPDVQQPDDYSCGAAALMAVAAYYGVGSERLDDFKKALGTNQQYGTYYRDMENAANLLGLSASSQQNLSKADLIKLLDEEVPVILSIQAYAADETAYDDPNHNTDGHYVVAIGYDADDNFYVMDPSLAGRRGYLSWSELDKRWHEDEGHGQSEISHHLGIVIRPNQQKPVYHTRARKID